MPAGTPPHFCNSGGMPAHPSSAGLIPCSHRDHHIPAAFSTFPAFVGGSRSPQSLHFIGGASSSPERLSQTLRGCQLSQRIGVSLDISGEPPIRGIWKRWAASGVSREETFLLIVSLVWFYVDFFLQRRILFTGQSILFVRAFSSASSVREEKALLYFMDKNYNCGCTRQNCCENKCFLVN